MTSLTTQEKLKHYKLSQKEFHLICKQLRRPPRGVEWALFSALWSEHCSYKSSKVHLKKFFSSPHKSPKVLKSFGENAGVIDLKKGEKVAFKIESHNHPSFIDPFQGAATGVGGILRDVFTMGARPIALANYLCFGSPKAHRMKSLINGVVSGISRYGNSVGIPTLTGQTEFHPSYNNNILVNALALGLFLPGEKVMSSKAKGVGNHLIYVGAKTGRDGLHGASMASQSFATSKNLKSTVQIGDPFLEKLLIESTLEAIQNQLVVAIQDMGAAGLVSSSFEMASRGEIGLKIFLDQVPLRDSSLEAEEILLSESQERMLLICKPKDFKKLKKIFNHWGLDASFIGTVEKEKKITIFWKGQRICKIDPDLLVKKAPVYRHPFIPYKRKQKKILFSKKKILPSQLKNSHFLEDLKNHSKPYFLKLKNKIKFLLLEILKSEFGCSRNFIYRQYDQRAGGKTLREASNNISVLKLPHSKRLLSLVLGGRPHIVSQSPRDGGIDALFYPYLELLSQGFKGLAVTNCLNFGNPTNKKVMSEFVACLEGMSDISKRLKIPIVSGNVSFYNETKSKKTSVAPTPATGLIGLRNNKSPIPFPYFTKEKEDIFLLSFPQLKTQGLFQHDLLKKFSKIKNQKLKTKTLGFLAPHSLARFSHLISKLVQTNFITSSRVVGKFGFLYTLSRMCMGKEKGEISQKNLESKKEIGCEIDLSSLSDLIEKNTNFRGPFPKKVSPTSRRNPLTSFYDPLLMASNVFAETLYQMIFCIPSDKSLHFTRILRDSSLKNLESIKIGETKGSSLRIKSFLNIPITELKKAYQNQKEIFT